LSVRRRVVTLVVLAWLATVGLGLALLWRYSLTPGSPGSPSQAWPERTALRLAADTPTLVLFVHPRCPCSRSTLGELARVTALAGGRVSIQVAFYAPTGADSEWARTDLWRDAEAIPGVTASVDEGGAEARLFGAATSGEALLYDTRGRLEFRGGITAARGHAGDNAGRSALVASILGTDPDMASAAVYGCPLSRPDDCE
jgi:hypothetical protein